MRIGLGYDIHRVVPGRRLVLGGVVFDAPFGLEGHSDADVVVHALMDAMLGAAGMGDIGRHFPPNDEAYRDADSLVLLRSVRDIVRSAGLRLVNADVVVVAEAPRISPRAEEMRRAIAAVLEADWGCISIKATTNERMGPEGRGEAISAQAIALLEALP